MRSRPVRGGTDPVLVLEALTAGLAYGAGLGWASVCLVGSFRPAGLSAPYWRGVPGLRTDTCGIVACLVMAVCLCTSEYLRLRRRRRTTVRRGRTPLTGARAPFVMAASETVTLVATVLVVYLSVNAFTHPGTLEIQATHLTTWPTEGTLRVIALFLCVCSITVLRYLLAERMGTVVSRSSLESENGEGPVHVAAGPADGFGGVVPSGQGQGADGEAVITDGR